MTAKERLLSPCSRPRGDDTDAIVDLLRIHDGDQSVDGSPDREESILVLAVIIVVNHQIIGLSFEQRSRRLESNPVLCAIRAGLGWVPRDPHVRRLRHWLTADKRQMLS